MHIRDDNGHAIYIYKKPERHTRKLKNLIRGEEELIDHGWIMMFGICSIIAEIIGFIMVVSVLVSSFEPILLLVSLLLMAAGAPMSYQLVDISTSELQANNAAKWMKNRENCVRTGSRYDRTQSSHALGILIDKTEYGSKLRQILDENITEGMSNLKGYINRLNVNPDGELWPKIFAELNVFLDETAEIDRQWELHKTSANPEDLAAIDETLLGYAAITSTNMQRIEDEHRIYIPKLKSGHIVLELNSSAKTIRS